MRINMTVAACLAAGMAYGCVDEMDGSSEYDVIADDLGPKYAGSGVRETYGFPSVGVINGCTGTLITSRALLTAAHCVPTKATELRKLTFALGGRQYPVSSAFRHPGYRGTEFHDLGVYILSRAVPNVEPSPISSAAPFVGQRIVLVGMGSTGGNGNYDMTRKYMGRIRIAEMTREWFSYKGNVRNCSGDSGGPAFVNGAIIGTVSTGDGDNCSASTGWNARVDDAIGWIREKAGNVVVRGG